MEAKQPLVSEYHRATLTTIVPLLFLCCGCNWIIGSTWPLLIVAGLLLWQTNQIGRLADLIITLALKKKFPQTSLAKGMLRMQTGDVLMHHGTGSNSLKLEVLMRCFYSHTAMVVRDPSPAVLEAYKVNQTTSAGGPGSGVYVLEATAQTGGVGLVPVAEWVLHELERNGPGYSLGYRQLNWNARSANKAAIESALLEASPLKFEKNKKEMFFAVFQANSHEDVSTVFCSELIAWLFKQFDLFAQTTNSSNWVTRHWCWAYGDDDADGALHLNEAANGGASLDPEVELTLLELSCNATGTFIT